MKFLVIAFLGAVFALSSFALDFDFQRVCDPDITVAEFDYIENDPALWQINKAQAQARCDEMKNTNPTMLRCITVEKPEIDVSAIFLCKKRAPLKCGSGFSETWRGVLMGEGAEALSWKLTDASKNQWNGVNSCDAQQNLPSKYKDKVGSMALNVCFGSARNEYATNAIPRAQRESCSKGSLITSTEPMINPGTWSLSFPLWDCDSGASGNMVDPNDNVSVACKVYYEAICCERIPSVTTSPSPSPTPTPKPSVSPSPTASPSPTYSPRY